MMDDGGELGDGTQCSHQQHKNGGGGICAFCLQEKLGNLVSSSSSSFVGASSSASSLSFRSDPSATAAAAAAVVVSSSSTATNNRHSQEGEDGCCSNDAKTTRKARIPFLSSQRKKKVVADNHRPNLALRRSNSTATPRRRGGNPYLPSGGQDKRGGFWSFLYPAKSKSGKPPFSNSSSARDLKPPTQPASTSVPAPEAPVAEAPVAVNKSADKSSKNSSETTSFGRRVSRSRSVGCGSRHNPGDLGDCAVRRVESQREGGGGSSVDSDISEGRVLCGGIFSGFMMASSSYLTAAEEHHTGEKGSTAAVYGRSKSWGWALASPMRVFGKPATSSTVTTKDVKPGSKSSSNPAPNLAAIPSLLTARGRWNVQWRWG